jgi:hypothetical protein
LTALLVVIATVSGCDASPPQDGITKQEVADDDATTIEEAFENADGWETVSGKWTAETSGDRSVLKQSATDQTYPVILLKQPTFTDVDVTVKFHPISGKIDASGGIVFRAQDGANYYVVRANSLEDNYRLYTTVVGSRKQIASTKIDAPAIGQWHTMRVTVVGDHIQAYLNDKLLIDHHDDRFKSGRVGLWTKADAVTEFDEFKATGIKDASSK